MVCNEQQSLDRSEAVQGTRQHRVRVTLPSHDPFRAADEECRIAPNPMAERLPYSAQRLWVHKANQDAISVLCACGANPLG